MMPSCQTSLTVRPGAPGAAFCDGARFAWRYQRRPRFLPLSHPASSRLGGEARPYAAGWSVSWPGRGCPRHPPDGFLYTRQNPGGALASPGATCAPCSATVAALSLVSAFVMWIVLFCAGFAHDDSSLSFAGTASQIWNGFWAWLHWRGSGDPVGGSLFKWGDKTAQMC